MVLRDTTEGLDPRGYVTMLSMEDSDTLAQIGLLGQRVVLLWFCGFPLFYRHDLPLGSCLVLAVDTWCRRFAE